MVTARKPREEPGEATCALDPVGPTAPAPCEPLEPDPRVFRDLPAPAAEKVSPRKSPARRSAPR